MNDFSLTHAILHHLYNNIATITIRQGRITSGSIEIIPVVGIATVELDGGVTYYFDCLTDLNNGSGLMWTRLSVQHRFEVESIPGGTPGKRLLLVGIRHSDLDVFICSDRYSDDVVFVNITGCECFIYDVYCG